jgi:tRNA threonylcarbamoyladenosine biosynthesis protein TsaB
MFILAVDTSWRHGSLALARGDAATFELQETAPLTGGAFSAELVPQIAAVLARRKLRKQDIDGFAAASGPGSFTGLRVGLAAIKALVEVLSKPIVPVSLLEALAITSGVNGRVFAALDAQRGEVFLGQYEVGGRKLQATALQPESLLTRDAFLATVSLLHGRIVTPDASLVDFAQRHRTTLRLIERPDASAIARIGLHRILEGRTVSAEALDANYVRRSDAEIFSPPTETP